MPRNRLSESEFRKNRAGLGQHGSHAKPMPIKSSRQFPVFNPSGSYYNSNNGHPRYNSSGQDLITENDPVFPLHQIVLYSLKARR